MMAVSFVEIFVLVALSGGMNSADLADLVEPAAYFKSREVAVSLDRMIDIVVQEPKDGKGQIMQLMALRHLANEADAFKKASNYASNREAIEEVATGKRANDPQGFAQESAKRLLAKLDGKKVEPAKRADFRGEALSWFPAEVTFAAAIDQTRGNLAAKDVFKDLLKLVPDNVKGQMYGYLEKTGNVRIERLAFGYIDSKVEGGQKIYVRVTGKANPEWIADAIQSASGGLQREHRKASDGTPIIVLQRPNREPTIALIGDTDILVVGFARRNGKQDDLLAEVLEVRAKKKPSAATGGLKDRLAKIPDKAVAFAIGDLPTEVLGELGLKLGGGALVPTKITAFIERTQTGLDLNAESALANANDADSLVRKIGELRKQGVEVLRQAMKEPQVPETPPVPFQEMIDILNAIQLQSKAERVQLRMSVPDTFIQRIGTMASMWFGVANGPLP